MNLKNLFCITILFLVSSSALIGDSPKQIAVNDVFINAKTEIKEKYGLIFLNTYTYKDAPLERLTVYFNCPMELSKEKARVLLLNILNRSLSLINESPQCKQFLGDHSFKPENIFITIYTTEPYCCKLNNIFIMGWNYKNFYYLMTRLSGIHSFEEEPYEAVD